MENFDKNLEFYVKKSLEKIEHLRKKTSSISKSIRFYHDENKLIKNQDTRLSHIDIFKKINNSFRDIDAKFEMEIEAPFETLMSDLNRTASEISKSVPTSKSIDNDTDLKPDENHHKENTMSVKAISIKPESVKSKLEQNVLSVENACSLNTSPANLSMKNDEPVENETRRLRLCALPSESKTVHNVFITHVSTPTLFWAQLSTLTKALNTLARNIKTFYYSSKFYVKSVANGFFLDKPVALKSFCAARFSIDRCWYRAQIIDFNKEEKSALVFYVDFGNSEKLPIDELRELAPKFYETPILALPFSLYNAFPKADDDCGWTQTAIDAFKAIVLNREIKLETQRPDPDWPVHFCILQFNHEIIVDTLVKQKFARKVPKEIIINHFQKFMDKEKCLIRVEFNLNDTQTVPVPSSPTVNNITKTTNYDQNQSFESQIDNVTSPIVDHNNNNNNKDRDTQSKSMRIKPRVITFSKPSKHTECTIVHIQSPSEFYICLANEQFDLYDHMEINLNEHYNRHKFKYTFVYKENMTLSGNMLCVVKSKNIDKFCRATVKGRKMCTRNNDLYFTVHLIDFGQYEDVHYDNMFAFAEEFCYLPAFVIRCSLDYIQFCPPQSNTCDTSRTPEWSKNSIDFFIKKLMEFKYVCFSLMNEMDTVKCEFDSTLNIILKAKPSNAKQYTDGNIVIINDEMIRYGYAQTIWDAPEKNAILPIDADDSEVQVYKLERIFKYLDDFTSSNMSKWDYEVDEDIELNKSGNEADEEYEFVPKVSFVDKQRKTIEPKSSTFEYLNTQVLQLNEPKTDKPSTKTTNTECEKPNVCLVDIETTKQSCESQVEPIDHVKKQELNNTVQELKIFFDEEYSKMKKDVSLNELDNWDPMKGHFESTRNIYMYDEENVEDVVCGYQQKELDNACRTYQKYGKCGRDNCPFIHTKLRFKPKQILTQVFDDAADFNYNEGNGYTFVLYYIPTKWIFDAYIFDSQTNSKKWFVELSNRMNKYYKKRKFLPIKTLDPFVVGEIVAVYNNNVDYWFRGRIVDVNQKYYESTMYKIEYLDYPFHDICPSKNVHPMMKTFLNYSTSLQTFSLYALNENENIADVLDNLKFLFDLLEFQTGYNVLVSLVERCNESISLVLTLKTSTGRICLNECLLSTDLQAIVGSII